MGARPWRLASAATTVRRRMSSASAARKSRVGGVPISTWLRSNSGLTWRPSAFSSALIIAAGAGARSRVSRLTRWYSSSMPNVNVGSLRLMARLAGTAVAGAS